MMFSEYEELLKRVQTFCLNLDQVYQGHLHCQKGCSSCCLPELSLFPVEAFYIRTFAFPVMDRPTLKHCCFLDNNTCRIYSWRPLVCRTQGYPLLYRSLDGDGFELSHCELNFKSYGENFQGKNLIHMENLNLSLAAVNVEFLKRIKRFEELKDTRYKMDDISSLPQI